MKLTQYLLMTVSLAGLVTSSLPAALVVDFNDPISALSGTPASVSAVVDPTLVGSSTLTRGSGMTANTAGGRFNSRGVDESSLANAIAANDFFTFAVAPLPAIQLNFSSISLTLQSSTTGGSNYAIFSSLAAVSVGNQLQSGTLTTNGTTLITINDATLGSAFDSISAPVTFWIYVWGGSATTGTTSVNALQVSASAIPEPGTGVLLLGGMGALLLLRRRRAKAV